MPNVLNFTPENNQSWISVQYNPDKDNSSSFHAGPVPFRVSVKQDAESGKYMIPILGNASIESSKLGIPSVNASMLGQSYFTIKPNLTITVIDPPSLEDDFRQFWSTYGQTISLFIAAFLGAFSTHMIDLVKQRKKEKNQARSG